MGFAGTLVCVTGMFVRLTRLFLSLFAFAAAVAIGGTSVGFRGILVMLSSFLVRFSWHLKLHPGYIPLKSDGIHWVVVASILLAASTVICNAEHI
jgi:hypothetical protein